ncbi:hypothetical protein M0802_004533 [Mischocyttarus mexicanus]|nr:hypothetical protein M0802_004533 [Mischocyttarus mexicanus]
MYDTTGGVVVEGRGVDADGGRNYYSGNEYFTINFAQNSIVVIGNTSVQRVPNRRFGTINYYGVMPQSIYYASHRMSPQMIHLRVCTAVLYALPP